VSLIRRSVFSTESLPSQAMLTCLERLLSLIGEYPPEFVQEVAIQLTCCGATSSSINSHTSSLHLEDIKTNDVDTCSRPVSRACLFGQVFCRPHTLAPPSHSYSYCASKLTSSDRHSHSHAINISTWHLPRAPSESARKSVAMSTSSRRSTSGK
jgi:hypothetical protein